eukprot:scaffold244_cov372-Pavlova_lutheri.AAC.9
MGIVLKEGHCGVVPSAARRRTEVRVACGWRALWRTQLENGKIWFTGTCRAPLRSSSPMSDSSASSSGELLVLDFVEDWVWSLSVGLFPSERVVLSTVTLGQNEALKGILGNSTGTDRPNDSTPPLPPGVGHFFRGVMRGTSLLPPPSLHHVLEGGREPSLSHHRLLLVPPP